MMVARLSIKCKFGRQYGAIKLQKNRIGVVENEKCN